MFGNVLGVLVVVGFWALVFGLMFYLVHWSSISRDDEQTSCELPESSAKSEEVDEPVARRTDTPLGAQP
jgi:hypothetical protein